MNILDVIDKYNLSVRKIPNKTVGIYDLRHYKEGDEVKYLDKYKRKVVIRTSIPSNAGCYMVKQVDHNDCIVRWNTEKDNLAPTLEESIKLFLDKNVLN